MSIQDEPTFETLEISERRDFVEQIKESNANLLIEDLYWKVLEVEDPKVQKKILSLIAQFEKAPYHKKRIRREIEKLCHFDQSYRPTENEIENLDLVDLYDVRKSILDDQYRGLKGKAKAIAETIKIKSALIKIIWEINSEIKKAASMEEAGALHAKLASKGFRTIAEKGLGLDVDYNDFTLEELNSKPHVFYFGHQGGGIEAMMVTALFDGANTFQHNNVVVKSQLLELPVFGDILRKLGSIPVDRNNLQTADSRKAELGKVSQKMIENITQGRGLIVFPEGTRSTDGNFAGSPQRVQWAKDIKAAINLAIDEKPAEEVLVVVDTLLGFPSALEDVKHWLDSEARINAGMKVKFYRLPKNIPFEENLENAYDDENFFGFARNRLAQMQREELRRLLGYSQ